MVLLICVVLIGAVLLAAVRFGPRWLLPVSLGLSFGSAALFGPAAGLAPLMGMLAAAQVARRRSFGVVVAVASAPAAFLAVWLLLLLDAAARDGLVAEVTSQLMRLGLQTADEQALRQIVGWVARLQPGIEFISLVLAVALGYRLADRLARRWHLALPEGPSFRYWRPWDELIWVAVVGLALALIGHGVLFELALNLLVVMVMVYAAQGLALVRFLAWRRGLPKWLEGVFYLALLFASGLAVIVVAGLGLLDTWFDWRRLRPAEVPGETDG